MVLLSPFLGTLWIRATVLIFVIVMLIIFIHVLHTFVPSTGSCCCVGWRPQQGLAVLSPFDW